MAAMLYRFAEFRGIAVSHGEFITEFSDIDTISYWATDAMQWTSTVGIITGRTLTTLAPQGLATRAETAAILQRFVEVIRN